MRFHYVLLAVAAVAGTEMPNNLPQINGSGFSSSFTPGGSTDLTGEYFKAQGSNGRSCASCHLPQEAWSITPETIRSLFAQTGGTHPIFNPLDADNPDADLSSAQARSVGYSMMQTRGVFRRGGASATVREWDVISETTRTVTRT